MPIYEYECEQCGVVEASQRITEPALSKCPNCKRKVRRLISNTSFQLKGGGWYVTDYARAGKSGGSQNGKDKGTASADPSSSSKSDSTSSSGKSEKADTSTSGSSSTSTGGKSED